MKRAKPVRLVSYVRPDLKREVERLAAKRGVSASVIVNLAVAQYVEKEGKS